MCDIFLIAFYIPSFNTLQVITKAK